MSAIGKDSRGDTNIDLEVVLLTQEQAAARLGVTKRTIQNMVRRKQLAIVRLTANGWPRIPVGEIERLSGRAK